MNVKGQGNVTAIRLTHKGCQMNLESILPAVHRGEVDLAQKKRYCIY